MNNHNVDTNLLCSSALSNNHGKKFHQIAIYVIHYRIISTTHNKPSTPHLHQDQTDNGHIIEKKNHDGKTVIATRCTKQLIEGCLRKRL